MKYQSPITYHSNVMSNIKDFEKKVKIEGQGQEVKEKVLKTGLVIRKTHVNYESLITFHSEVMANGKGLKRRSHSKVKVKS